MVESLRLAPHIRARIEGGPLAPYLVPYVGLLRSEGYTDGGIRRHLSGIDVFGAWLAKRRVGADRIDQATVAHFARGFRRHRTPSHPHGGIPAILSCVRKFVAFLGSRGVTPCVTTLPSITEADLLLRSFDEYLCSVKGLAPSTRRIYLRYAQLFLETRLGVAALDWSGIEVDDIVEFVLAQVARLKPTACRAPVTAIRALLRYLVLIGAARSGFCGAVPTVRQWKHASLPAYLSAEDVERVLDGCGADTAIHRRDRAILLLLARLGLRASEVAGLRLDDIDWRQGRLTIRAGKSHSPRDLPLPCEVGEALAAYLRGGRPDRRNATVFVRSVPPHHYLSAGAVSSVAKRALARTGVSTPRLGAHVFRHSAATWMVRRGATFKEIADVLGHARLQTTAIYAKLDLPALARVALPWPGGQ
jgi:site-specific recombinase XerD